MKNMRRKRFLQSLMFHVPAGLVAIFLILAASRADNSPPIPGIGPTGPVRLVQTGFQFTEGPAADSQGNLYFSELQEEKIYKLDDDGKLTTFLENSGRTNGLMFDAKGRLIACESGANRQSGVARIVAIHTKTKLVEEIAGTYRGRPFNRVNDLVVDRQGGVYFTDILGGESDLPQETAAVYYVSADGKVSRLVDDLERPNGVILSPDEETLYVLPAGSPVVMRYPLRGAGKLGQGAEFCSLPVPKSSQPRGGDGLTIDTDGNLYVTVPAMSFIQVVSPQGKVLGTIDIPESPANCTFGGKEMRTLYVTARTSIYAVPMEATGHRFAAN